MKFFNAGLMIFLSVMSPIAISAQMLEKVTVAENVWAIVGPTSNRTPENLGNNATFGVVVTPEGVILIDSGGTMLGASKIHDLIKTITNQPVKYVINTGGQDHRWFGNEYFSRLGATIISSNAARQDQEKRLTEQWGRVESLVGKENMRGTVTKYADTLFDTDYRLRLGGVDVEICHRGQAHTPGDSFVWLPKQRVMFTGDIVYTERMLSVSSHSNSRSWVKVFEGMAAFRPKHLVPGHGKPTTLAEASKDTYRYLVTLRQRVAAFMEAGHDISEISKVDQTEFSYLGNYDQLKGRNAQRVFAELEWE